MIRKFFIEAFKYGLVGILNTLLTAVTIWVMMYGLFSVQEEEKVPEMVISVSNIVGYTVGLTNSFICNRKWTFKSTTGWKKDFIKFIIAFLISYIPQLLLVNILNNYANIPEIHFTFFCYSYLITSAYICQLIGIVFYTIMNFLCNKYYTFKKSK
jgi:putative flippase GtrA